MLADKNLEITKKNEILQVQEVTLAIENGGETRTEEEQALVANVDAMPNLNGLMTTTRMIGMVSMWTLDDVNVLTNSSLKICDAGKNLFTFIFFSRKYKME